MEKIGGIHSFVPFERFLVVYQGCKPESGYILITISSFKTKNHMPSQRNIVGVTVSLNAAFFSLPKAIDN